MRGASPCELIRALRALVSDPRAIDALRSVGLPGSDEELRQRLEMAIEAAIARHWPEHGHH